MKKSKPSRGFKVEIDFLEYTVTVFSVIDPKEFRNGMFRKLYPAMPPYEGEFYALYTYYHKWYPRQSFLILPKGIDSGTLVHEIVHAVDAMIKLHGLKGTEVRAHLTEYLFNKIKKKLKL